MTEMNVVSAPDDSTEIVRAVPQQSTALAIPSQHCSPPVSEKVRQERLTPTARKEFRVAIERRSDAMLEALNTSIGGDVDTIIQNLRLRSNIKLPESKLRELVKGCDDQIKAEITTHLGPEKLRIESEIEQLNDDFDTRERDMKARHKSEWDDLKKGRKAKLDELKVRLVNAEESVRKTHTPFIVQKKQNYMAEIARVAEIEATITHEADQQVRLIKHRKHQLRNLVEDATGRALERLLMVETRDDANNLVLMIPTVQDALALSKSAKGLQELMHRLDNSIPMPEDEQEVVNQPSGEIDHSLSAKNETEDELEGTVDTGEDANADADESHGEDESDGDDVAEDDVNASFGRRIVEAVGLDASGDAAHDDIYQDNAIRSPWRR